MEDLKIKDLKWKYIESHGKVTVEMITNAPNKVLDETLKQLESWNRELFKREIQKQGFDLEYVDLKTY